MIIIPRMDGLYTFLLKIPLFNQDQDHFDNIPQEEAAIVTGSHTQVQQVSDKKRALLRSGSSMF